MVSYVILYAGQIAAWLIWMTSDECQMGEFEMMFLLLELLLMFVVTCFANYINKRINSYKVEMLENRIRFLELDNEYLKMKNLNWIDRDKTEEEKHEQHNSKFYNMHDGKDLVLPEKKPAATITKKQETIKMYNLLNCTFFYYIHLCYNQDS